MKLPSSMRCLTRVTRVPICVVASILAVGLPVHAVAQSCGGSISGFTVPNAFLVPDLPDAMQVVIIPAVGVASANLLPNTPLRTGLTCADTGSGPGLSADCTYGDDAQFTVPANGTPVQFVGYVDPDTDGAAGVYDHLDPPFNTYPGCDVTGAPVSDGNGRIDFPLNPATPITQQGCVIVYDATIADKGSDTNPLVLSQVFTMQGICGTSTPGAAQGTLDIFLTDPICEPEVEVCVAVDTDHDGSFDDEECGPDMIGLNATGGPGNTTEDAAKPFRYSVTGNKSDESLDLGLCQVQQCIEFDGPECITWADVTSEFPLDSTTPADVYLTDGTDACSAEGDSRTFRIVCDTCDVFEIPSDTDPVEADVECADCDVRVVKQVSCDDGNTWGDSCTGWDGDDETWFRYTVANVSENGSVSPVAVDIDSCALTDDEALVLIPAEDYDEIGPIYPGDSATIVEWMNPICEDGEGSENGNVSCACLPTRDGAPLEIDDNVVGPNDVPEDTFAGQSTSDTDPASLYCESAGLNVFKTCEDQDICEGTNNVTITVSNATADAEPVPYEADLTNCTVDDALLTTGPFCVDAGNGDAPLTIPFSIQGSGADANATYAVGPVVCTGTVEGLTSDTNNEVSVTCNVEDTTKTKTDTAEDMCTTSPCEGCITRTPGFWGTHPHVTSLFLPLEVCGVELDEVIAEEEYSATEDMCSVGKDAKDYGTSNQQVQLVRQCTAAALNIAASTEGGGSCGEFVGRFESCCSDLCNSGADAATINASGCIEDLDFFNNSEDEYFEWEGSEDPFESPGPANSQYCRDSKNNGWLNPGRNYGPAE